MPCFGSADSNRVTGTFLVSADSKRVSFQRAEVARTESLSRGCTPGVLQKSLEIVVYKRVVETRIFQECGRV